MLYLRNSIFDSRDLSQILWIKGLSQTLGIKGLAAVLCCRIIICIIIIIIIENGTESKWFQHSHLSRISKSNISKLLRQTMITKEMMRCELSKGQACKNPRREGKKKKGVHAWQDSLSLSSPPFPPIKNLYPHSPSLQPNFLQPLKTHT